MISFSSPLRLIFAFILKHLYPQLATPTLACRWMIIIFIILRFNKEITSLYNPTGITVSIDAPLYQRVSDLRFLLKCLPDVLYVISSMEIMHPHFIIWPSDSTTSEHMMQWYESVLNVVDWCSLYLFCVPEYSWSHISTFVSVSSRNSRD